MIVNHQAKQTHDFDHTGIWPSIKHYTVSRLSGLAILKSVQLYNGVSKENPIYLEYIYACVKPNIATKSYYNLQIRSKESL